MLPPDSALLASAAAYTHGAAAWTAAPRASPSPWSGAEVSGACCPIGADRPGGDPSRPSDRAANRSRHLAPGVHSQYRDTEERQVGLLHQDLARVIGKARDQAKSLTSHSSSLYLALVSIRKRLLTEDPAPPPVSQFVPELEGLLALCSGKLAPIKPLLEEALRMARR